MDEKKNTNKKLNLALIRALAALLAAAALLALSGFAVLDLLKGPVEAPAIQEEKEGAFVFREIFAIIGFYADETSGGKVTARYGLVPMNGKYVSVRFSARYLESADAVYASTKDYIDGASDTLDLYFVAQGTVGLLKEETSGLMYQWFDKNYDQLVSTGIIGDGEDVSEYLTDYVLVVDTVKGHGQTSVVVLTALAAAAFLYMLVELVLMGTGFYVPAEEPVKEAKKVKEEAKEKAEERAAEATDVTPPEESAAEIGEPPEESAAEETGEPLEEKPEAAEEAAEPAPEPPEDAPCGDGI